MHAIKPVFVFVHGFWHSAATWDNVVPLLTERGFDCRTIDLPGAGSNSRQPAAYSQRPFDAGAFATEASPNAGVTQAERTRAVIELIKTIDKPVVLVAHSMGGATASDVAEQIPERLKSVTYVAGFMLTPGLQPITMIKDEPKMSDALIPTLFLADPARIGALRMNMLHDEPAYRSRMRDALFEGNPAMNIEQMALHCHCDEPVDAVLHPSAVTVGRYGTIERHYIRCTEDRCVPIAGQDLMIASMDEAMGNTTTVHTLATGHMPFYSEPDALAGLLMRIADAT